MDDLRCLDNTNFSDRRAKKDENSGGKVRLNSLYPYGDRQSHFSSRAVHPLRLSPPRLCAQRNEALLLQTPPCAT